MDPLSITVSCISLLTVIGKTTIVLTSFVRDVRGARSELDSISRELLSLSTILKLLAEDFDTEAGSTLPSTLQNQIAGIVENCTGVVNDIERALVRHEGARLRKAAQWVAWGREDVVKLRGSLEAHKSALEIALDMVAL